MGRKITIGLNDYPSDKELFDLVMSGMISPKKLQECLRDFGIIVQTRDRKKLAESLVSILVDHAQLQTILSHTDVKENRVKVAGSELNTKEVSIEEILAALQEVEMPTSDPNSKVRIEEAGKPTFDKDTNEIVFIQSFKKLDYSRTTLLQEEPNEFRIKIVKQSDSILKMTYSTSDPSSEYFLGHLRDEMIAKVRKKKPKADIYHQEIISNEIPSAKINEFFVGLIGAKNLGMKLVYVTAIHMTRPQNLGDKATEDNGAVEEKSKLAKDDKVINNVRYEGKNLLDHEEVKSKIKAGYVIRSIEGQFIADEQASSRRYLTISIGFLGSNKFFSEIKSCEIESIDSPRESVNLSTEERENYLRLINESAFNKFEELRVREEPERKASASAAASVEEHKSS